MPYLGSDPGAITDAFTDTFTGDASDTTFTLTQVSTTNAVFVRIHGVVQRNGVDFSVDGTTITFTTAPPAASNNVVVQYFTAGSIQTVADNAITLAKLAGGTDGNLISFDASGDPVAVATGNDGQVLTSAGAGAPPAFEAAASVGWTQGTETATTSGTSFNITGIPSGTQHIIINFEGVSVADTNILLLQIGDAGGIETSGYVGEIVLATSGTAHLTQTTSFPMYSATAANLMSGQMNLTLKDAANFTWVSTHIMVFANDKTGFGASVKSLSAELTQLTLSSSGTFDAGSFNIMYQ
jgi:hypothetical protein